MTCVIWTRLDAVDYKAVGVVKCLSTAVVVRIDRSRQHSECYHIVGLIPCTRYTLSRLNVRNQLSSLVTH